jgi:hypothetical protein
MTTPGTPNNRYPLLTVPALKLTQQRSFPESLYPGVNVVTISQQCTSEYEHKQEQPTCALIEPPPVTSNMFELLLVTSNTIKPQPVISNTIELKRKFDSECLSPRPRKLPSRYLD